MLKENNINKIFIKEALGTRNYLSYRTDLMLYKIILSIIVFLVIYLLFVDFILAILISVQVFVVFTLMNKLNISRKKEEGEEKIISRTKMEYLKNKLNEMNNKDFEMLTGFLLEKEGWNNFANKGRHMYLAENKGIIYCIKIFKLNEEIEVEKLDLRNMISYMSQNNIRKGLLVYTSLLSEDANTILEKFKDKLEINLIDLNSFLKLMEKNNILPDNRYFYNKILDGKNMEGNKTKVKNNVFDKKKTLIYVLAAIFFYILSKILQGNYITKYTFYYFAILAVISISYFFWYKKYEKDIKN
ncbi:MAG: restriction endonuclease [Sedimentibacter sp.]|uniref:restriction endonuclease n=1 Tax=Sedimentibacter sp. TaxID=1960295 RepID=UPI002982A7ED|nr:restriction endonuclease [Sedimentibacter sp.]MDW5298591.1 restriction endonuclease [Sedimentibacter sp.]